MFDSKLVVADNLAKLVEEMLSGHKASLSRLISLVEGGSDQVPVLMKLVYPRLGKAHCVGITGPPGSGKSSLIDRLTGFIRNRGQTVGIVCIDPTSPFSGGAILGDTIRMQQHYEDQGVFLRSMASRGSTTGLARTVQGVIRLLDASGKDYILLETVGVGQTQMDIVNHVDTVVIVLTPEAGDIIQTLKGGLLEAGDIFVVNKAERAGASQLVADLEYVVHLRPREWRVPVLTTQVVNNIGVEDVYEAIDTHRERINETGELLRHRRKQRQDEFTDMVKWKMVDSFEQFVQKNGEFTSYLKKVGSGEIDPYSASEAVVKLLYNILSQ